MNIETNEIAPKSNTESVSLFSQAMDGVTSNFQFMKQSAENLASEELASGLSVVKEHPIDTLGYAAGAVLGGATAIICLPLELTAGGAVLAAAAGAAAVDGGAYLVEKMLASQSN